MIRSNKQRLIKLIMENLKQFGQIEEQREANKQMVENLKIFSIGEFSNYFQVLSNTQHLLSIDSSSFNRNNDFIFVDDKLIDFNEKKIIQKNNTNNEDNINTTISSNFDIDEFANINKFIKRKDLSMNNLIREKMGNNFLSIHALNPNNALMPNTTNVINNNSLINQNYNTSSSPQQSKAIDHIILYESLIRNLKKEIFVSSSDRNKQKIKNQLNLNRLFNSKNKIVANSDTNVNIVNHNSTIINDNLTSLDEISNSNNKQVNELELNDVSQISEASQYSKKQDAKIDFLAEMRNIIKLHLKYVYLNNCLKIEKEDKIIFDFLFDNINNDFFEIAKFWLFEEFLMANNEENPGLIRRYENLLNEFIQRMEKQEIYRSEFFSFEKFYNFLTEIPQYNEKVIDLVIKFHPSYLEANIYSNLNENLSTTGFETEKDLEKREENFLNLHIFIIYKKLKKKVSQINQLLSSKISSAPAAVPNNQNFAIINFNMNALRSNYMESLKKIRGWVLNLSYIEHQKIIETRIRFISNKILPLGDVEEIQEYSRKQFESLMKYNDVPINKNVVLSKYGLFFYLCISYPDPFINDFIKECPKVYADCSKPVCEFLEKIIEKNFIQKTLTMDNLRYLVQNCSEKCLNIVLLIVKNFKSEIGAEKLYKEILKYYSHNGEPKEILLFLSLKINTFFMIMYDKLKICENFSDSELLEKIFNEINYNANEDTIFHYLKKDQNINANFEQIYSLLLEKIKDKIIFYILFFIEEYICKKNIQINKIVFFIKFFEKLSLQEGVEKLNENLNYLLELITLKNLPEINFFQLINFLLEYFKERSTRNIILSIIFF